MRCCNSGHFAEWNLCALITGYSLCTLPFQRQKVLPLYLPACKHLIAGMLRSSTSAFHLHSAPPSNHGVISSYAWPASTVKTCFPALRFARSVQNKETCINQNFAKTGRVSHKPSQRLNSKRSHTILTLATLPSHTVKMRTVFSHLARSVLYKPARLPSRGGRSRSESL